MIVADELLFEAEFEAPCPCGQTVAVGYSVNTTTGDRYPSVAHPNPQCELFIENDPISYVAAIRLALLRKVQRRVN